MNRFNIHIHRLCFLSPAFLGDAEPKGAWRTPPFKHLLRAWWRVAWAAEHDPGDWRRMRHEEGVLFGHAWLEGDHSEDGSPVHARRSQVLVRLRPWKQGKMKTIPRLRPAAAGRAASSELYLGYGPVKGAGELKHPAIDAGEGAELRLAWPREHQRSMQRTLALIHAFGTLGGRSRNGWGSIHLEGIEPPDLTPYLRPWEEALTQDWPHAIGKDGQGALIWRTDEVSDWQGVMERLAAIRKAVNGEAGSRERPILNQPVTRNPRGRGRMPSNLGFKVCQAGEGAYYGLIYHLPHTPPPVAEVPIDTRLRLWQRIHRLLDRQAQRLANGR